MRVGVKAGRRNFVCKEELVAAFPGVDAYTLETSLLTEIKDGYRVFVRTICCL